MAERNDEARIAQMLREALIHPGISKLDRARYQAALEGLQGKKAITDGTEVVPPEHEGASRVEYPSVGA